MKLKKFFMGLLGAAALTACSSDIPLDNPADNPGLGEGENFISVAIQMPTGVGSRATQDGFDDGTAKESEVSNVVFFLFDAAGNCIDVQKIDNPTFSDPAEPSVNPNISNYGTVEVRLKAGLKYKYVGVALNSPSQDATELKSKISSISDFLALTKDYASNVKEDGSGQVMSNSIYYAMKDASETPDANNKVDVVEITDKNIYTSTQKPNLASLIANKEKEYVNIYVERVLAKIVVTAPDFTTIIDNKYYVSEENGTQKKTITVYDHVNGKTQTITVKPVVKGMILNVLTRKAALVKPLLIDEVGYGKGEGLYKSFQWNDPVNKRSYWATTALPAAAQMSYKSWNDAVSRGNGDIIQYIHPNTQDFKPLQANEGGSLNTKLMVVAELQDGDGNALDLVMFGADYMLTAPFLAHVASLVNRDIRNIDWTSVNLGVDLSVDQINKLAAAVNNAYLNAAGYQGSDIVLTLLETKGENKFGDEDWAAAVKFVDNVTSPSVDISGLGLTGDQLSEVRKNVLDKINGTRDASMDRINVNRILYWKGGKTYFYTNIRHQGFYGLTGDGATNFLYGVVRNHVYNVNLTGIYGLGTPVIDPGRPINPDRPNDERPSYISAKINILPWRVVTNNATIH